MKRILSILTIILLIIVITIGYSILSSNLNINGTSKINNATWDIHFENIQVKSGSVIPENEASILSNNTIMYSVLFNTPGDYYEFTVDVKNSGTINGMIENVSSTINNQPISNLPNYLEYHVTYVDDVEIESNHMLAAGTKETYKIHIEFKKDIALEDLPNEEEIYNMTFVVNEVQASSQARPKPVTVLYYTGKKTNYIGNSVPSGSDVFNNYNDAINTFGHPMFIKYMVDDGVITQPYLGIFYNNTENLLRAQGGELDNIGYCISQSPYYETNKEILASIFGDSNCTETSQTGIERKYQCSDSVLTVSAFSCGLVEAREGGKRCGVVYNGGSSCGT